MALSKFYDDFSKGMNDTTAPTHLVDSEVVLAENVALDERGGYSTRKGLVECINAASTYYTESYIWNVGSKQRKVFFRVWTAPVIADPEFIYLDEQENITVLKTITTTPCTPNIFVVGNLLYLMDGTEIWEVGGTDYVATEGTVTIALDDVVYNNIPGGDKKFYKAKAAHGSTDLSTEDFTNATKWDDYTDIAGVISQRVQAIVPNGATDNDIEPIKKCTMFAQHPDSLRVFASGNPDDPTALYFSESADFSYFKLTSILRPIRGEGKVTGLIAFMDSLMVSYGNAWYHWQGIDPDSDATWKPLPIPNGCIAPKSLVLTPMSITYLSIDGIYNVSVGILSQEVMSVQPNSVIRCLSADKVESSIGEILNPEDSVAVFYDNKYMLAHETVDAIAYRDKILVYEWKLGAFHMITNWKTQTITTDAVNNLYIGTEGLICKGLVGDHDIYFDGVSTLTEPIPMKVVSRQYFLGYTLNPKYVYRMYLIFKQYTETESNIQLSIQADYRTRIFTDVYGNIDLTESLVWGRDWGSNWGWRDVIQFGQELSLIADNFQVTLEADCEDNPITCYGIGFDYDILEPDPTMTELREGDLLT